MRKLLSPDRKLGGPLAQQQDIPDPAGDEAAEDEPGGIRGQAQIQEDYQGQKGGF
jgi:hypothetical protein